MAEKPVAAKAPEKPKKTISPEEIAARAALRSFLSENSPAKLVKEKHEGGSSLRIINPWGDETFVLNVPDPINGLADALNNVLLPKRLSALWHKDTHDLEVIWTALNIPKSQKEVASRSFEFEYKEIKHRCEFSSSSDRLLEISKHLIPRTLSPTNWRNLQSFSQFSRLPKDRHERFGLDEPRSFWIRDANYSEDEILLLIENLNFYMTYFDSRCPNILVHDPSPSGDLSLQKTRYIHGSFPASIQALDLDSHMLSFWNSAYAEDPMMSYLLYFRIIEYAATHFIDSTIRAQLRKALMAPDLRSRLLPTMDNIMGAMNLTKMDETQKFKAVLRHCVSPSLLWKDVEPNLKFFAKSTEFDGGFTVKCLVNESDTEATFSSRGVDSFADSARKIRNALTHGKDLETAGIITPTTRNVKLFRPWVHLIGTAAGEVVLYKDSA